MIIDGYAHYSHYVDHIAPIWNALPEEIRGYFHVEDADLVQYCADRGIEAQRQSRCPPSENLLLVAAGRDANKHAHRRHILLEHGAGQTYTNAAAGLYGYAGGPGRDSVELFICPSKRVVEANLDTYPQARAVAVGPPRLDPWLDGRRKRVLGARPHVVVSTHMNSGPCQEALSAWPEYSRAYAALAGGRVRVSKHGHPRWADHVRRDGRTTELPFIRQFDTVLDTADVYVCDNSSTQYETAALGIPNIVVNSKDYRRDVHHGLRFWSHIPGPQVDRPEQMQETVREVLGDLDLWSDYAQRVATDVYDGLLDGHATERAVEAILELEG